MFRSLTPQNASRIFIVLLAHAFLIFLALSVSVHEAQINSSDVILASFRDASPHFRSKSTAAVAQQHNQASPYLSAPSQAVEAGMGDQSSSGEEISPRAKIYGPKPRYPLASRQLREQGAVLIQLCVNPQGAVQRAKVLKSSGFKNLDTSALDALSEWRFASADSPSHAGVGDCFQVPVQFSLEG